jgi:UDP-glucose 4-epimerase
VDSLKKILITGANGYIGARLSQLLAENNCLVTVHCFPSKPSDSKWLSQMEEVVIGDLTDSSFIDKLTDNYYDVVIHLVSLDHHQSNSAPSIVSSVNVLPVWNLLEKFASKSNLDKFIYFSTFQVYGKVPTVEITESFMQKPLNAYGLTHLMAEKICSYYNRITDINCINVRLSNSYGSPVFQENNCWWLVINDLCKTAFDEGRITLLSDGLPQRDFIHSTDVFKAIEILVNTDENNLDNNTYHVCSGKTLTILELAHLVKDSFFKRYKRKIQVILPDGSISENSLQCSGIPRYTVSNLKLRSLGFSPETNLQSGIEEIFEYLENFHDEKQ